MAGEVVDLALATWNTVMQAPEGIDQPPESVREAVEGATTADGSARAFFEQRYGYYDDSVALRGNVLGEALEPAVLAEDGTATVSGCVSVSAENTADTDVEVSFREVEGYEIFEDADTDGAMTVTVRAEPQEVRWQFGDDEWTCPGPGAPYSDDRYEQALDRDGFADDADLCTYLFTIASNDLGGPVASQVRVVWDYSWSLNGIDQGMFAAGVLSPATEFDLTIIELQAVVTS